MEDRFSRRLEHERDMGKLFELQTTHNFHSINHSQFVNDTLLLGGASRIIARLFKQLLESYIYFSRSKVNKLKIQIFGWNYLDHILRAISTILEFPYVST